MQKIMKLGNDRCKCIIDKFIWKSVIKIHNLRFYNEDYMERRECSLTFYDWKFIIYNEKRKPKLINMLII